MVNENYLAPGGKEYTITAGNLAGLNQDSKILDIACGQGIASINLVKKFGCRAIAVDIEKSFILEGKKLAKEEGVADKINFINDDFNKLVFEKESFDMIIAEGGAFSHIGKTPGLKTAYQLLKKGGYLELSDLIMRSPYLSKNIEAAFNLTNIDVETEESYRQHLKRNNFEIIFCSYIAQHYWNNYYDNIQQNLKNRKGVFADENFRENLEKEMNAFYQQAGIEQLAYLFMVAKKK